MPSLRDCIGKAGKLLHPGDAEALHARAKEYISDGHPAKDAERMAVDWHRDQASKQLEDIHNQAGVPSPPAIPKPKAKDAVAPPAAKKPIAPKAEKAPAPPKAEAKPVKEAETKPVEKPATPEPAAPPKETKPTPKPEAKAPPAPEPQAEPEAPRRSMDDDTRTPPAMMKPEERLTELKEAGVKEINGKPLEEANRAEIINAVGKLRRGKLGITDEPRASDRLIQALEKAKINKPGEGKVRSADPFSVAYDSALDLAILGVKAGRELAHMIELAVKRFKAAYPKATAADTAKLEKAIRDAHSSVNGKEEAPAPTTPERKVEKKAAEVISSPKAEETRSKISKAWNDAREGANLKDTLKATNEAAENQAKQTGQEAHAAVSNEINRGIPMPENRLDLPGRRKANAERELAADALAFHREAGEGGVKKLAEMKQQIEASTKANPKWKAKAIAAIDYATANFDKLKKASDLYKELTDQQVDREQQMGMPTLKRDNYVMHAQDIEDGTWLERLLGAGSSGTSPSGASSRKNRVHATFADSIAAGVDPKTINALELLRSRITAGETGVNLRQWQNSLHNYVDPKSGLPIAVKPTRVERADGSEYYDPPKGYKNEFLGGQTPIAVKNEYAGTIGALTDPSWFSKAPERQLAQKVNGFGKSVNLLIDTFHLGRLAIQQSILKGASITDPHLPIPSFKRGLNILDHSPDEMRRMAANGEIHPDALPGLLEKKRDLSLLTAAGLNTGHIADAMHQELIRKIPGIGDINKFIFEKFQRGAMAESALMEFERQKKSFSDLSEGQVAKQVARDINTRFGNLGKQGWFTSRTSQDIMRMIFLAPGWNEGLIRSEFRGVRQIGESIVNAATGKRFAMGALGRQMIAGTLGIFAANQILNQATRGKFTWDNPEEEWGAKLSAWIPDVAGKSSGFFLNPLGITAEISHQLLTSYERTGNKWQPFIDFARGRISAIGRPIWTAIMKENGLGQRIKPDNLLKEVGKSAVPSPIGASAVLKLGEAAYNKITGNPNAGNTEVFPGQFQKQGMQSIGVKTDTAPSPEQRIYSLAQKFNRAHKIEEFKGDESDYKDLDAALRRNNTDDIKAELQDLLKKKTHDQIEKRFESYGNHAFTGQKLREAQFVRTLNPEQRATYLKAKRARIEMGMRGLQSIRRMPRLTLQPTGSD